MAKNYWGFDAEPPRGDGTHFVDLVSELRELQDRVACSNPTEAQAAQARHLIEQANAALESSTVVPGRQDAGTRSDVPGRGHPLFPATHVTGWTADRAFGQVRFSRFYLGGGTAVHGGAVAFVFDDFIGRLPNNAMLSRTAYLTVNYRRVCPVETELDISCRITRIDGRKKYLHAELKRGNQIVADAEGLWVNLRRDATAEERGEID